MVSVAVLPGATITVAAGLGPASGRRAGVAGAMPYGLVGSPAAAPSRTQCASGLRVGSPPRKLRRYQPVENNACGSRSAAAPMRA